VPVGTGAGWYADEDGDEYATDVVPTGGGVVQPPLPAVVMEAPADVGFDRLPAGRIDVHAESPRTARAVPMTTVRVERKDTMQPSTRIAGTAPLP
jgi:hypothetical protein